MVWEMTVQEMMVRRHVERKRERERECCKRYALRENSDSSEPDEQYILSALVMQRWGLVVLHRHEDESKIWA